MIKKIISGGQTGADQAGLDAAIDAKIPHGGFIPKGRLTEVGQLPAKYNLVEMRTKSYPARTKKNIFESDGTVIFTHGRLTGGSLLTRQEALKSNKPVIHIDFKKTEIPAALGVLSLFITSNQIEILNIAGSRASKDPLVYPKTKSVIERLLDEK
jgi:hypothetical protein